MAFSSWLCTNSTKNMLVKIVHPGGHVELHDRPVLAAEIMHRNPRCCVAYPHVFKEPSAIVAPDTMLMLGQKFYVVPISTIRKLQLLSPKHSSSPDEEIQVSQNPKNDGGDAGMVSTCWLFTSKDNPKTTYACQKHSDEEEKPNVDSNVSNGIPDQETQIDSSLKDKNCFVCLITGIKIKHNGTGSNEVTNSSSSLESPETRALTRKRTKDSSVKGAKGSSKRRASLDSWQPSLESITEE